MKSRSLLIVGAFFISVSTLAAEPFTPRESSDSSDLAGCLATLHGGRAASPEFAVPALNGVVVYTGDRASFCVFSRQELESIEAEISRNAALSIDVPGHRYQSPSVAVELSSGSKARVGYDGKRWSIEGAGSKATSVGECSEMNRDELAARLQVSALYELGLIAQKRRDIHPAQLSFCAALGGRYGSLARMARAIQNRTIDQDFSGERMIATEGEN